MGGIRRQKKKTVTPGHPYDKARLERELPLVGEYGLRNKKELWKARTILSKARQQARALLAHTPEVRKQREEELLSRLIRFGMLSKGGDLDSVLALEVKSVLNRRLQTIVHKKGLASTPYQARQFIVHRHIAIENGIVTSPGRLITVTEEEALSYAPRSPLADSKHPSRPQAPPVIEEVKAKPKKEAPKEEEIEEEPPEKPEVKPKPEAKPKPKPEPKVEEKKPPTKPKAEPKKKVVEEVDLSLIEGIGPKTAMVLKDHGFDTVEKIAKVSADDLSQVPGIGKATAEKVINNAKDLLKTKGGSK
ncbi:MAG: 30S ribosomal protein S4 [Candidatus Thorarchaeota archaeon]